MQASVGVDQLTVACRLAYEKHPGSCSDSVWEVMRAMGLDEPHRNANDLVDFLVSNWEEQTVDQSHVLANLGKLVIGGLKDQPNGHVIVVYPGPKKCPSGYQYFYKKLNKMMDMRGSKPYPLCMSTSLGSTRKDGGWPGAMSCGDKTIWDPWAKDETFAKVKFWSLKT